MTFLDKLRSLRVHAEFHNHFGRVRKRDVRSERSVTARGRTEQFRRAWDQLSAHFRGHAYASGDEHATAESADRGASKTTLACPFHCSIHSQRLPLYIPFFFLLFQTFDFVTNVDGSVAYLYSLKSGHVVRSFAHAAARSAGLDEKIVKRALEVNISTDFECI